MAVGAAVSNSTAQSPSQPLRDAQDATGPAAISSVSFDAVLLREVDVKAATTATQSRQSGDAPGQALRAPKRSDPDESQPAAGPAASIDPALMPRVTVPTLSLRDAAKLDIGAQAALEQQSLPDAPATPAPQAMDDSPAQPPTQPARAEPAGANQPPTTPQTPEPAANRATDTAPNAHAPSSPRMQDPGPAPGQSPGAPAASSAPAATTTVTPRPARSDAPASPAGRSVQAVSSARGVTASGNAGQGAGPALNPRHAQSQRLLSRLQGRASAGRPASPEAPIPAQVGRAMADALRRGEGEVTLHLRPEALGKVDVRLSVHDGAVNASITPQTDSARRLLQDSLSDLRAALEARDLRVERITIEPVPETHGAQRQDADSPHSPMSTGGDSPGTHGGATHGGGAEAQAGGRGFVPFAQSGSLDPPDAIGWTAPMSRAPFTLDAAGRVRVDAFA